MDEVNVKRRNPRQRYEATNEVPNLLPVVEPVSAAWWLGASTIRKRHLDAAWKTYQMGVRLSTRTRRIFDVHKASTLLSPLRFRSDSDELVAASYTIKGGYWEREKVSEMTTTTGPHSHQKSA